jgi:hypothetical protein
MIPSMFNLERADAREALSATMQSKGRMIEAARAEGIYSFRHWRRGKLLWEDVAHNIVCTDGKNVNLDAALAGSSYTVTGPYMGLISSVSWTPLAQTISSGTYTTGTGAVSLTLGGAHGLGVGDSFTLASVTGTGSFAALDGTSVATAGTTGSTLNFTTVTGLTMTITGGNVTTSSATRIGDTMASHGNWTEAGNANAPTYTENVSGLQQRPTCVWSAASGGAKALSAGLVFTFTSTGTLEGAFICFGSGAVHTIDNTSGHVWSAGAFLTGARSGIQVSDTLTVSYTTSL